MHKYFFIFTFIVTGAFSHADTLNGSRFLVKTGLPTGSQSESVQIEIPYPKTNTEQIAQIFKAAVNRGELKLFEATIAFSELKPQHVEYVYRFGETIPTVKVYSLLNKSLPFPAMPEVHIEGVTVILDAKGHIIEAVMHSHY
jgi:hypothetical protein